MSTAPATPDQPDFEHLLRHAGFALVGSRAFLRITGSDATRWLNGMVTNSIQALAPGEGNYNFLLNAQGRIQGDCLIFREPATAEPEFLLVSDAAQIPILQQHLDRFIIMDDVELTPSPDGQSTLLLLGPQTPQLLAALGLPALDPLRLQHASSPYGPVFLFTPPQAAVARAEIGASPATLHALHQALAGQSVPEVTETVLEQLRIFEGTPRFGTDIRERELPQETSQTHALHFAKGCYLGQEIVERIRSRGQVHRVFTAFRLEGCWPTLPLPLELDGQPVGELTSAAEIPLGGTHDILALGYARREALAGAKPLTYRGGVAYRRALRRPG
jgi:folate-binding protein YgfZ